MFWEFFPPQRGSHGLLPPPCPHPQKLRTSPFASPVPRKVRIYNFFQSNIWLISTKSFFKKIFPLKSFQEMGFPGALAVMNPPSKQETKEMQVQSLDWEDPLEEEGKTQSGILA